jgi:hypothetical protein
MRRAGRRAEDARQSPPPVAGTSMISVASDDEKQYCISVHRATLMTLGAEEETLTALGNDFEPLAVAVSKPLGPGRSRR